MLFFSVLFQWDCVFPASLTKLALSWAFLDFSTSKECLWFLPYFVQVIHVGYSVLQTEHLSVVPCWKSAIIDVFHLLLAGVTLADWVVSSVCYNEDNRPESPRLLTRIFRGWGYTSYRVLWGWWGGEVLYWSSTVAAHNTNYRWWYRGILVRSWI